MVAIKNLLFLITAASALVLPRDYATVRRDLETINSDTTALKNAVNAYDGSFSKAIAVNNAGDKLSSDLKTAIDDANASNAATETEAQNIIDYINGTLEPNIKSTLSATKAKKAAFTSGGLKSTVQNKLASLRTDSSNLGAALKSKAPASKQSAAQASRDTIDADFADAIAYYQS